MKAFNFLVSALICVQAAYAGMAGGWSTADPQSSEIQQEAKFAVQTKYPNFEATFKVVNAMKQVVAGMKYDLVVEVTLPSKGCKVDHYQVWDRFGAKTLAESDTLAEKCQNE